MIGLVAALVGSLGDLLLLATSNATRPGFEWLGPPSEGVLLLGTYLGVVAIPLYTLGYRDVAACFDEPYRRAIIALGFVGATLGGSTHALTGLVIHVESANAGGIDPITLLGRYGAYLLPLWAAIGAMSVIGSVVQAVGVLRGRSWLPQWFAFASPLTLTVALALAGATSETGRAIVVPAAPNLAHVAFFGLVAAMRRGREHAIARASH